MKNFIENFRCIQCKQLLTNVVNRSMTCSCENTYIFLNEYSEHCHLTQDLDNYRVILSTNNNWETLDLFSIVFYDGTNKVGEFLLELDYMPNWIKENKEQTIEYIQYLITFA